MGEGLRSGGAMRFSGKKQAVAADPAASAARCWIYVTPQERCSGTAVPRGVFCSEHGAGMVEWLEADEKIERAARKGEASERRATDAWLQHASPAAEDLMADDGLWNAFEEKRLCSIPVAPGVPCAGQRLRDASVCAEHLAAHKELKQKAQQASEAPELSPAAQDILADVRARPEAYGLRSRREPVRVVDLREKVADEEMELHPTR